MSQSMTVLKLDGAAEDWHLHLDGDWSLPAIAHVEAQLDSLSDTLHGTLVCDWSRAEAPGIGPVWALLVRLAEVGTHPLEIRRTEDAPHYLDLLVKLKAERNGARAAREAVPRFEHSVGEVGRWAVRQAVEARGGVGFFWPVCPRRP